MLERDENSMNSEYFPLYPFPTEREKERGGGWGVKCLDFCESFTQNSIRIQ